MFLAFFVSLQRNQCNLRPTINLHCWSSVVLIWVSSFTFPVFGQTEQDSSGEKANPGEWKPSPYQVTVVFTKRRFLCTPNREQCPFYVFFDRIVDKDCFWSMCWIQRQPLQGNYIQGIKHFYHRDEIDPQEKLDWMLWRLVHILGMRRSSSYEYNCHRYVQGRRM